LTALQLRIILARKEKILTHNSDNIVTSLFMSDDGVYWADKNRSLDEKTGTKDAASEFLPYLVENEVPIYV